MEDTNIVASLAERYRLVVALFRYLTLSNWLPIVSFLGIRSNANQKWISEHPANWRCIYPARRECSKPYVSKSHE